ncbi:Gfo/Idh/MocA family protein [Glaciibacter superstes]|uniref:Gfo/Idh/MocA family protein n=1 Tax=Glaciibacter superstes TaxID=501023 RepID=UPI0003B67B6E|nr:Gfo/Idh/MocA family oxidoreductase [Glaciibacter superstes]
MHSIAIIGQGRMGRTHAEAWSDLGLADNIRYVCTPRPGAPLDHAPSARFVTELDDVLADDEVDILSVCTPTPTHASIAIRALEAGKNVLLEKPIALGVDEAHAIAEAAANSTATLMVAHVVRFFRGYQELRETADAGGLGPVRSVDASRLSALSRGQSWLDDESLSGGVLVDFAIHDFDQLNLFLGTPAQITAVQRGDHGRTLTTVEYVGGGVGRVETCSRMPPGHAFESSLRIEGANGSESFRYVDEASDDRPYRRQAAYFLHCIEHGVPPVLCPTDAAVLALRVSLAAHESLRRNRTVMLP